MLTNILCEIDDFFKFLEKEIEIKLLPNTTIRNRPYNLTMSEIITIAIYYH